MDILEKTQVALAGLFPESALSVSPEEEGDQDVPPRESGVLVTDFAKHGSHLDVLCRPAHVFLVAQIMDRKGYFLAAVFGVDVLNQQHFEVLYYHHRLGGQHSRVMERNLVTRHDPLVPNISTLSPS